MHAPRPETARTRFRRTALALALGCAMLAGVVARARSFHFDREPRPAVSIDAQDAFTEAAREVVSRAHAVAGLRGCVAIARGEEVLLAHCESGPDAILTPTTRFSIGSLWKQFIGVRVHELARGGRLALEDHVDRHLPELRGAPAAHATLRDLLLMRSGLPFVVSIATNARTQLSSTQRSDADYLREVAGYGLSFEPGSKYQYSNVGYGLLALIVGRVEGKPWREAFADRFAAIGMPNTGYMAGPEPSPPVVAGYLPLRCGLVFGGPCMVRLPRWNYSMLPGGGAYSSIEDFLAWLRALRRVEKEDPVFFAELTASVDGYASGWAPQEERLPGGETVAYFDHSAEDPGYYANFARVPSRDLTLVYFTDTDFTLDHASVPLFHELLQLALGEPYDVLRP